MKNIIGVFVLSFFILACSTAIKNEKNTVIEEEGTEIQNQSETDSTETVVIENEYDHLLGFWVGYFEADHENKDKTVYVDDAYAWNRDNKINISIDQISDTIVIGHSVVAGNDRPFKGVIRQNQFIVREPGDNKYDGEFIFRFENNQIIGNWIAFKNIEIKKRKYTLERKEYKYNRDVMLERKKEFVNWEEYKEHKETVEYDENQFEEWIQKEFSTATDQIYSLNASNVLLKKADVENLKKGDLKIIRNTIYARHGYSFKNRPLRVFFDAQSWYIPVHADIKAEFTEIEKKNIELLLRFEKNAAEYYDSFGRG